VWNATDGGGRLAALKLLGVDHGRARFLQEHRLASLQEGKWTPEVLDADLDARPPWIAFEHLEDDTLHDQAPLEAENLRSFALKLWLAINSLHLAGIAHRDITPKNIFYDGSRVKLIDFGLASDESTSGLTASILGGTPGYAAPEQFAPGAKVDEAADVWAWGTAVYYAATGRRVYRRTDDSHQTMVEYLDTLDRHHPDELSDVPEWLQTALRSALELPPEKRDREAIVAALPATDEDRFYLQAALQLLSAQGAQISVAPSTVFVADSPTELLELRKKVEHLERMSEESRPPRRARRAAGAAMGLAVAATAVIGILLLNRSDGDADVQTTPAEQTETSVSTGAVTQPLTEQPQEDAPITAAVTAATVPATDAPGPATEAPSSIGSTLSVLAGAPETTDRGTVLGTDHPGAMSIPLDQAGCEGSAQLYELLLPPGEWDVVGTIALSDATPDGANIETIVGQGPSQILTVDRQNASFNVLAATESISISVETLSAFGSSCGEMPIEVLIFDSFIR